MFEVVTLCVAQLALADLGGVGRDAKCQRSSLLLRLIAPSAMPYQSIVTLSA